MMKSERLYSSSQWLRCALSAMALVALACLTANKQVIGTSEMYTSTAAMEKGIASVQAHAPGATMADLT